MDFDKCLRCWNIATSWHGKSFESIVKDSEKDAKLRKEIDEAGKNFDKNKRTRMSLGPARSR